MLERCLEHSGSVPLALGQPILDVTHAVADTPTGADEPRAGASVAQLRERGDRPAEVRRGVMRREESGVVVSVHLTVGYAVTRRETKG